MVFKLSDPIKAQWNLNYSQNSKFVLIYNDKKEPYEKGKLAHWTTSELKAVNGPGIRLFIGVGKCRFYHPQIFVLHLPKSHGISIRGNTFLDTPNKNQAFLPFGILDKKKKKRL